MCPLIQRVPFGCLSTLALDLGAPNRVEGRIIHGLFHTRLGFPRQEYPCRGGCCAHLQARCKLFELMVQHVLQAYPTAVANVDVILFFLRSVPQELFITVRRPWISSGVVVPLAVLFAATVLPREPIGSQRPAAQLGIPSEVALSEVYSMLFETLPRVRHWTGRSLTLGHREAFGTDNLISPAVGTDPSKALRAQRLGGVVVLVGGLHALRHAPLAFQR